MKIAPLAEHALTNALLKQYLKVIYIKLTRMYAPTAELAPMFVQWRQSIRLKMI
jgi:hypothetical protein